MSSTPARLSHTAHTWVGSQQPVIWELHSQRAKSQAKWTHRSASSLSHSLRVKGPVYVLYRHLTLSRQHHLIKAAAARLTFDFQWEKASESSIFAQKGKSKLKKKNRTDRCTIHWLEIAFRRFLWRDPEQATKQFRRTLSLSVDKRRCRMFVMI